MVDAATFFDTLWIIESVRSDELKTGRLLYETVSDDARNSKLKVHLKGPLQPARSWLHWIALEYISRIQCFTLNAMGLLVVFKQRMEGLYRGVNFANP